MGKGTPSFGRRSGKKTHIMCRRCAHRSYHVQKKRCSYCAFGKSAKLRKFNWNNKLFQNKGRKYPSASVRIRKGLGY